MRGVFLLAVSWIVCSAIFAMLFPYSAEHFVGTDFVEIGNTASETAHSYEIGVEISRGCLILPYVSGELEKHCGVSHKSSESFLFRAEPGRNVVLKKVVDTASADVFLEVFLNDKSLGVWSYGVNKTSRSGWAKETFFINKTFIAGGDNKIQLKFINASPDVNSYGYQIYSAYGPIEYMEYYFSEYTLFLVVFVILLFVLLKVKGLAGKLWNQVSFLNRMEFKIFLLFFIVYGLFAQNYFLSNEGSRLALTSAIVENRSFIIDFFYNYTYGVDYTKYDNHFYSDKPFGSSFLAIPPYLLTKLFLIEDPVKKNFIIELLTTSLISAIGCVVFYLFTLEFTKDETSRFLTTIAYGFGTLIFPWSTLFISHPITAVFLFTSFYIAYLVKHRRVSDNSLFLSGTLVGLSPTMEYQGLFFAIPIVLYVVWCSRFRAWKFILPVLLCSLSLLLYNWICFNDPLTFGTHRYQGFFGHHNQEGTFYGVSLPKKEIMINLLFRTSRGLFIYNPILIMSIVGFLSLLRTNMRLEAIISLAVFLIVFLFNAGYLMWDGGWSFGPRFLIPGIPFISLLLTPVFNMKKIRYIGFILLILSVIAMLAGVSVNVLHGGSEPLFEDIRDVMSKDYNLLLGSRSFYFSYLMLKGISPLKSVLLPLTLIMFLFRSEIQGFVKMIYSLNPRQINTKSPAALSAKPLDEIKRHHSLFSVDIKRILLFCILLLAAFLRLNGINYVEFKGDEAGTLYLTIDAINGHLPQKGIVSSIGIDNPPLMLYLLLVPVYISAHPMVASMYVACLNIAAVLLCYYLVSRFFGESAGLIASLLYAVNPWAVLFSRKVWGQDFLPLFVILFFYSILEWAVNKKSRYLVYAFVFLSCSWQLHLAAIYLTIIIPIVWLVMRPLARIKHIILGVALFILFLSPYIYYEVVHEFSNCKVLIEYTTKSQIFHEKGLFIPLEIMTTLGFDYSLGDDYREFLDVAPHFYILDLLPIILFAVGMLYLCPTIKHNRAGFIIILWFFVPYLLLLFNKSEIYHHYYLVLFPVQFIVLGILIERLMSWGLNKPETKGLAVVMLICILLIAIYQIQFTTNFQEFIKEKRDGINGDYGLPLEHRIMNLQQLVGNNSLDELKDLRERDITSRYILDFVIPRGS